MNTLSLPDCNALEKESYNQLIQICRSGIDRVSELGPSDNKMELSIKKMGLQFFVTVKMVSWRLVFSLQAKSRSPFMAVESALRESLNRVQKWSLRRS